MHWQALPPLAQHERACLITAACSQGVQAVLQPSLQAGRWLTLGRRGRVGPPSLHIVLRVLLGVGGRSVEGLVLRQLHRRRLLALRQLPLPVVVLQQHRYW